MFSDHHGIIIEVSNKKNFENFTNTLKTNNIFSKKKQMNQEGNHETH